MNLKPSAERFEQRTKVKIITGRIIKALLKSKINYVLELIYNYGVVSGISSLNMFLLRRPKSLLLAGPARALFLENIFEMLLFSSRNKF